mgnify:CR=1 FL=1
MLSFLDIHEAILAEAKEGIPFPFKITEKPLKVNPKEKKVKIKRDISPEKVKDLVLSRKKCGCSICGYSKCIAALEFHHVNPSEKLFAISKAHSGYSLEEILKELEKCILVCSNCHKEIHAGFIKLK